MVAVTIMATKRKFHMLVLVNPKTSARRCRLYAGTSADADKRELLFGRPFDTVEHAKGWCLQQHGINPTKVLSDEIEFDAKNPTHAALQRIESRQTGNQITAVGSKHYMVRRSRLAPEVPIRYRVRNHHAEARHDIEDINNE